MRPVMPVLAGLSHPGSFSRKVSSLKPLLLASGAAGGAALLLPALAAAREETPGKPLDLSPSARALEKARQQTCLSNEKQIGFALKMYLHNYDEVYPAQYDHADPGRHRTRQDHFASGWNPILLIRH